MRVYSISPRDDVQLFEVDGIRQYEVLRTLGKGQSFEGEWPSMHVKRLLKPRKRKTESLCDLTNIASNVNVPAMSARAKSIIEPRLGQGGEWLPLSFSEAEYWLLNILRESEALDLDRSTIRRFSHGPVSDIETFAFREDLIAEEWLFKVAIKPFYVLATDGFRDFVNANGLTGFHFQPVWDSEHEPFHFEPDPKYLKTRPDIFGPGGFVTNYEEYWPEEWKVEAKRQKKSLHT